MAYAICEITEDNDSIMVGKMIAALTNDEMLALGRLRGLRFHLLMADDVGHALDKLSPAFDELAVSRLDRRLKDLGLQGPDEPSSGDDHAMGSV